MTAAPAWSRTAGALRALPGAAAGSPVGSALGSVVGGLVGGVLGAGFGLAARIRRNKPLHPAGAVGTAVLDVTRPAAELGVPLLATGGRHESLVRWSRSAGVPAPLPDVEGFAVRILDAGGGRPADLLFASSGEGAITRYTLLPRGPRSHGPLSTLLPVAGPTGPLLFLVEPLDDEDPPATWRLAVAGAGSDWRAVATITVTWGQDEDVRFDPVENQLPGTRQYPLVRMLREPAYAMARHGATARPS
jgi:hypothetical protein